MRSPLRLLALGGSAALVAVSAVHVAWGVGSSWPAPDRRTLAENMAGATEMPSPRACFTVAAALGGAAALVGGAGGNRPLARLARAGVATVLIARGVAGLTGTTSRFLRQPAGQFTTLDRRYYGPLCIGIGTAVAVSALPRGPHPARIERTSSSGR